MVSECRFDLYHDRMTDQLVAVLNLDVILVLELCEFLFLLQRVYKPALHILQIRSEGLLGFIGLAVDGVMDLDEIVIEHYFVDRGLVDLADLVLGELL